MEDFKQRVIDLQAADAAAALRPSLNGDDVMKLLNIGPSPTVGKALAFLLEAELDEGPLPTEVAIERILDWWASQPHTE